MILDLNRYRTQLLLGNVEELTAEETRRFAYWATLHDAPPDRESEFVLMALKHPLLTSEELENLATEPRYGLDYLTAEVVEAFLSHPAVTGRLMARLATLTSRKNTGARSVLQRTRLGASLLVLAPACSTLEVLLSAAERLSTVPGGAEVFNTLCRDENLEMCWMSDQDVRRLVESAVLVCGSY